ncbi:hypothetical protein [Allonocardiopsis opalescens]|uniref:Uncharacterized protein n=1 Tax=Allonocardiopsis opalescens TaxID=1144618 RepID=A0A2T0PXN8_9ACTN|nr:hypothetical protein [Allonocardiopsis opalescens]PRX96301.1 hypothetical protein CLV72_108308 [Allonocardiopsis opalescens]
MSSRAPLQRAAAAERSAPARKADREPGGWLCGLQALAASAGGLGAAAALARAAGLLAPLAGSEMAAVTLVMAGHVLAFVLAAPAATWLLLRLLRAPSPGTTLGLAALLEGAMVSWLSAFGHDPLALFEVADHGLLLAGWLVSAVCAALLAHFARSLAAG